MPTAIAELRQDYRSKTLLAATLQVGANRVPVRIRNISSAGALIETHKSLHVGRTAVLTHADMSVAGQVVWADGRSIGFCFSEKIDDSRWRFAEDDHTRMKVTEIKPSDYSNLSLQRTEDDTLPARVSEEIDLIARTMRLISETMVADPILRQRYSQLLQEMDLTEDRLKQMAQIVRAGCTKANAELLATGPLRARLLREKKF